MLCAYYGRGTDSYFLFSKTRLARQDAWDSNLGQYNVISLNMLDFLSDSGDVSDMLSYLTEEVTDELIAAYPEVSFGKRLSLRNVCSRIYAYSEIPFVIIIDEWDAIFRNYPEEKNGQRKYLDFLRDWLKDKPFVALA